MPLTTACACSLVTIVLAASGASANFFKPKFSGGSFSGFPVPSNPVPSNVPPTRVPGPNDGVRTEVSAKVECTAEAAASSLIGFTDVFASACVSLFPLWMCIHLGSPGKVSCPGTAGSTAMKAAV